MVRISPRVFLIGLPNNTFYEKNKHTAKKVEDWDMFHCNFKRMEISILFDLCSDLVVKIFKLFFIICLYLSICRPRQVLSARRDHHSIPFGAISSIPRNPALPRSTKIIHIFENKPYFKYRSISRKGPSLFSPFIPFFDIPSLPQLTVLQLWHVRTELKHRCSL